MNHHSKAAKLRIRKVWEYFIFAHEMGYIECLSPLLVVILVWVALSSPSWSDYMAA